MHDQEVLDRFAGDRPLRMALGKTKRIVHHHAVGHRRIDCAEPVLAVEPLFHPRHCTVDRALS
jgi:hypothetical protein